VYYPTLLPIVSVNATLAAAPAAVVQRLDFAAMHEEACGILATIIV
jgi:hypothetical protein